MSPIPDSRSPAPSERPSAAALRHRLAELRGAGVAPRPLDARALAALATNPGCRRRALLDGAGVDKGRLAEALDAPAAFGQSQFAFARGHAFEARVVGDGGAELARLVHTRMGEVGEPPPGPGRVAVPDLSGDGPAGRAARTRRVLERAAADGGWTLLRHPMVVLEVAGSPVHLEPDAVVVRPDGRRTIVEVKSFPILDGAADPAKVGAATRQAAVYALALERLGGAVDDRALLVCPKDFSNLPTAEPLDLRKQMAATRRQLARMARLEEVLAEAASLPGGASFDPARPAGELARAVEAVPASYAPECLSACELAFHCRERARAAGAVAALGREVRGELGGPATVGEALAAARGEGRGDREDPAAAALRRAARLRAEVLDAAQRSAGRAPCR